MHHPIGAEGFPSGWGSAFPDELAAAERKLVRERREALARQAEAAGGPAPQADGQVCGLAISGGGIRSATFGLGVLQGLAKLGVLRHFDYLSTVSGGGYVGSFLGGVFSRPAGEGDQPPTAAQVEAGLSAPSGPQEPAARDIYRSVRWLRENGRYLTPGGSGDGFLAAAMMVRNFLAVHLVMGLLWLLLLFLGDRLTWALGLLRPERMEHLPFGLACFRSAWFPAALPVFAVGLIVFGWAYWLVPHTQVKGRNLITSPWVGLLPLWGWTLTLHLTGAPAQGWQGLRPVLDLASLAGLVAWLWNVGSQPATSEGQRTRDTTWLRWVFLASLTVAAYGLVDSVGWTLWAAWFKRGAGDLGSSPFEWLKSLGSGLMSEKGAFAAAVAAVMAFREKLEGVFGKAEAEGVWKRLAGFAAKLLVAVVALFLVLMGLGALSALAHGLAFGPYDPGSGGLRFAWTGLHAWLFPLGLGLLVLVMARTIGFLNLSTLGPTYTAALTRAYVGASSSERRQGENSPRLLESDDLPWKAYTPWKAGGPLHLVNTTLNETTGGKSQVVQKDRKGMNLAAGPAGFSVGARHHALLDRETGEARGIAKVSGYSVFGSDRAPFKPELLTLGQWMGISGAAASTGMGSRTSLVYSLWLGMLNVRLGYWWWSDLMPRRSFRTLVEDLLPVHAHLLEEWTAHFPGSHSRHWYLTDGGHFENTAAYELIRRRLPFILVCDDGADSARQMDDLANLVAKARLDLAAEIRVLDGKALADRFPQGVPGCLGDLGDLRRSDQPTVALLAEVDYLDPSGAVDFTGLMVVVKPTMSPRVPMDVAAYHRVNPDFPQETTADQFFDESQWESYRRLGEFIAVELIGEHAGEHPEAWFKPILGTA
jgi:hypothetical protein